MPRMYNNSGWLTTYGLACGLRETQALELRRSGYALYGVSIELWLENGTYLVRTHNHSLGRQEAFEGFSTLSEARKEFRRQLKEYGAKRKKPFVLDFCRDLEMNNLSKLEETLPVGKLTRIA